MFVAMSRLILVDLDEFCTKDAGVALSEEEELVKTRELAPGTVPVRVRGGGGSEREVERLRTYIILV